MTYREKLQQEHPECVSDSYAGGCRGCPQAYGYGPEDGATRETCIAWGKSIADHIELCRECWDQEIPGEEPKTIETDVDDVLEALQRLHENAHMTTLETDVDDVLEALQRLHENAHMTTLTAAFYNTVSAAVEDYGGNAERLYHYLRGVCDLVDNVAALMTEEEEHEL